MAFDGVLCGIIARQLAAELTSAKIEKIQQPERDLLLLTVRREGSSLRLLIRIGGQNTRLHLTRLNYENPREAPMFCMFLRKHLTGARIREIEQPNGDRLLLFRLNGRSELGDDVPLTLAVELMGRAANVILLDAEDRIMDCIRRIPLSEHGSRALLPGLRYEIGRAHV